MTLGHWSVASWQTTTIINNSLVCFLQRSMLCVTSVWFIMTSTSNVSHYVLIKMYANLKSPWSAIKSPYRIYMVPDIKLNWRWLRQPWRMFIDVMAPSPRSGGGLNIKVNGWIYNKGARSASTWNIQSVVLCLVSHITQWIIWLG